MQLGRRTLGRAGLEVTELGFGSAPLGCLGHAISDELADGVVQAAWQAGIRYFDTAPSYGAGLAEQRLGSVLARLPRAEFVISTKVGRLSMPHADPYSAPLAAGTAATAPPAGTAIRRFDFTADGIRSSLAGSLSRLGLDHVDIVLAHDPDIHLDVALREAFPALARLRADGVIGAMGVGTTQPGTALACMAAGDLDVVMIAGRWTLADRGARRLVAECARRGIAVLAAGPFNSGLLASPQPSATAPYDYRVATPAALRLARGLAATCARHGAVLPQAAIQFPLREPAVAAVVAGMNSAAEVASDAAWLADPVSESLWAELG
jgi:D-threo-aldose 1-dehydrogenase